MAKTAMLLSALVGAAWVSCATANSMHIAKICRGHVCTEPQFPILDFAEGEDKCICRAHPCWDADGVQHSCDDKEFQYLSFEYNQNRSLSCGCSKTPFYGSYHIAHDLCPGHYCESPDHSVLDWDTEKGDCICRAHPCADLDGMKHECSDPKFPILKYREEKDGEKTKQVCECSVKLDRPEPKEKEL